MVGVRSMGADARDDSNSLFFGGQVPEAGVRGGGKCPAFVSYGRFVRTVRTHSPYSSKAPRARPTNVTDCHRYCCRWRVLPRLSLRPSYIVASTVGRKRSIVIQYTKNRKKNNTLHTLVVTSPNADRYSIFFFLL